MVFNSLEFLVFFLLFIVLYSLVEDSRRVRNLALVVASYCFYCAWYWEYSLLILLSSVVDFAIAKRISQARTLIIKRILLVVSLVINLGLLAVFKYFNFFIESVTVVGDLFNWELGDFRSELLLPIGISFYTFQTLSYTIDVYREKLAPTESLLDFAAYVSFFPQLVAGPIVRATDFLPQLKQTVRATPIEIKAGLLLILMGLIKKVMFADTLASLAVDAVFEDPAAYSSLDLLLALYGYTFQIYCDFSGYSDMAIGLALVIGFKIPSNFERPYISLDPSEFWRRWHVSLSSWLRDYLYISLGGNRGSTTRTQINLALTMLLGGLWHGAAWNFVLWGIYQGALLAAYRPFMVKLDAIPKLLKWFIFFHLTVFGWLLFRSPDLETILLYSRGLLEFDLGLSLSAGYCGILTTIAVVHFVPRDRLMIPIDRVWYSLPGYSLGIPVAAVILLAVGFTLDAPQFIYFQF